MKFFRITLLIFLFALFNSVFASVKDDTSKDKLNSNTFAGLKFRSIGPAWNSGRIADFAVNPKDFSEYYVATASGHLWKTSNSGVTWSAIADSLPYSLACVVLDPNNPFVVWVGSGENNHQRALGYGNGVYKSTDGGSSWNNMGLKDSRQIGGIVIDPRNSDVVYVAAEGSAWGPGGERGLYKTTDGGKTWNRVLYVSENTGINNIVLDPKDPNVLYATSEQRRRHHFTKIGGGPESAVYKSTDSGASWNKIMSGLPSVDIGGMGIAVSPVNTDVVYLIIEAAENKSGFFRSVNRGASWEKMSDYSASGQYYNEIYCDPINVDKVYSTETVTKVTIDGGKTWNTLGNKDRHVDDHALWINPNDTKNLLIGGDGGIYETFDAGANWQFKPNLPVTQFYRVTTDNDLPFYNIYGGTQDNQSMGGPSRTLNSDGIVNNDWKMTVGGDGFFQAVDPTDPNIVYSEWQYGNIIRYDKKSGESITIRPEPLKDQKTFKWYWDTPFIISPHSNTRLYIAAEKVFRSDDRGDSWQQISDDLTTKTDRNSFKVMDKYWSTDAVSKDVSTSQFGLIVSLDESKIKENLIYIGTDDGLIQVTEDAKNWRKLTNFTNVPEFTFVSDICASRFNENVVYTTFNNHKRDDFNPYVLKSEDKGKTWKSISGNLPKNGPVSTIIEDPVNANLLFVGTEWGIYFTIDGGQKWIQLKSGIPNVKVPDIAIQERENDLVVATFGRGFYLIDDYSPLRNVNKEMLENDAFIFPIKDALMFNEASGKYGQGASYYKAPNPEIGAVFTFYIKEVPKTLKSIRKEKEKELFKKGEPITQPSYEEIKKEEDEIDPYLIFSIKDESGAEIKKLFVSAGSGVKRVVWDLRLDHFNPVQAPKDKFNPTNKTNTSLLALPGKYSVSLSMVVRDEVKQLAGPTFFNAIPLNNTTLPAENRAEQVADNKKFLELAKKVVGARAQTNLIAKTLEDIKQTVSITSGTSLELFNKVKKVSDEVADILFKFEGQPAKASNEEIPPAQMPLNWRINEMVYPTWSSTSNITKNQIVAYDILSEELPEILNALRRITNTDLKDIEKELENLGATWTPGRIPEIK